MGISFCWGFPFVFAQYERRKASVVPAVSVLISKVPNVPLRRSPSSAARAGVGAKTPAVQSAPLRLNWYQGPRELEQHEPHNDGS